MFKEYKNGPITSPFGTADTLETQSDLMPLTTALGI